MAGRSYSIDYTKINDVVTLVRTLPLPPINRSPYFSQIHHIFNRVGNLSGKYKVLMDVIMADRQGADKLIDIWVRGGRSALEAGLKKRKSGFNEVGYSDTGVIKFSTRHINPALQDYIGRYAELLETVKYLLADIYQDHLGDRDSFNQFIAGRTTRCKQDLNFDYLTDFNKCLWNEQKHSTDISVTPIIYERGKRVLPKLRIDAGRFKRMDLDKFLEESLNKMIELLRFIHSKMKISETLNP